MQIRAEDNQENKQLTPDRSSQKENKQHNEAFVMNFDGQSLEVFARIRPSFVHDNVYRIKCNGDAVRILSTEFHYER